MEAEVKELKELGDVLAETGTKQAEWLIGAKAIGEALQLKDAPSLTIKRIPADLPVVYVKSIFPGKYPMMVICYRPYVADWLEKHQPKRVFAVTPEQIQDNRLALVEKAIRENTETLKMFSSQLRVLMEDIAKIL